MINLVILFVFFCAFESMDLFFQLIGFSFYLYVFYVKITTVGYCSL